METEQLRWTKALGWKPDKPSRLCSTAKLVLAFGATEVLRESSHIREVRNAFPNAHVLSCSTAGEIHGTEVTDDSLVVTAVAFEHTEVRGAKVRVTPDETSRELGRRVGRMLPEQGLVHVFVLSEGLQVNGSELVEGLTEALPSCVTVTGGLSGDGARFQTTYVLLDGEPETGAVAAIGFYGDRLRVGFGSLGGWDTFGPERLVTRSSGSVLYELDGRSALQLYKSYLGEHANGLPATGLLFPLSVRSGANETGVVRTILSVDEAEQSMTFAGDIPVGSYARLMKANFDRLIDGAVGAASACNQAPGAASPGLAVLISCVGRKLILKQRIEEEVEGVRDVLGEGTAITGFYSYGEISPFTPEAKCTLHNQTMTITTFAEV